MSIIPYMANKERLLAHYNYIPMTTSAHSRLGMMNTRERKPLILSGSDSTEVNSTPSSSELPPQRNNESEGLKLTLPEANTYEPTNAFTSSRTQMRMLKVKVDKGGVTNPERTSISTSVGKRRYGEYWPRLHECSSEHY